jgi:uracil-DNA glycosylase family 4
VLCRIDRTMKNLPLLHEAIIACEQCPRLREHCGEVARVKVRRYRDQEYWGRPVPGFGDPRARLLILGLAPGAHGANRTGRMFTGDDSGAWLYGALHAYGFANQPDSLSREDGLTLTDAYVTAAGRCAPPDNKPLPAELDACRPFLHQELALLDQVTVVLALGRIAFDTYLKLLREQGYAPGRPAFGHGALHRLPESQLPLLLCSYHPSRQNTQTGRLTQEMWHGIFATARALITKDK